jgi:hypothetical protein
LRFISDPPLFPGNDHRFALDMSALPQKANIRSAKTMSALGQKQTSALQKGMSALPPKADMCDATRDVCFGPIADIEPSSLYRFNDAFLPGRPGEGCHEDGTF